MTDECHKNVIASSTGEKIVVGVWGIWEKRASLLCNERNKEITGKMGASPDAVLAGDTHFCPGRKPERKTL